MTTTILPGDVLKTLQSIAPGSIRCSITSPPYYGLRSYLKASDPLKQYEIGSEKTPELYIEKMVNVFRLVHRALSNDGTLWLNLGDSYATSGTRGGNKHGLSNKPDGDDYRAWYGKRASGYKEKDLMMIPARVAMALQADGWYLRSEIIWHKPNPMPESVKDRPTRSHEVIYLLSKSQKYYYDAVAIEEPLAEFSISRLSQDIENQVGSTRANGGAKTNGNMKAVYKNLQDDGQAPNSMHLARAEGKKDMIYTSRNKRDVWTVPTTPYAGAHYAVFPPALIEPCVLAGTSAKGQCPKCGSPWVRQIKKGYRAPADEAKIAEMISKGVPRQKANLYGDPSRDPKLYAADPDITIGWAPSCHCDAGDPVPDIVLDPFGGSGTVAQVATMHRRDAIICELNQESIPLIHERLSQVQTVMGF